MSASTTEKGSGTLDDPKIVWKTSQPGPKKRPGWVEAVEAVCRDACIRAGLRAVWIRSLDHDTTQSGRITTDDHVTVYMSSEYKPDEYEYEGHVCVHYDDLNKKTRIPSRMSSPSERWDPKDGPNPELFKFHSSTRFVLPEI
ncbi:hypothetical protein BST61_g5676 [Cercospora zeina]